jgi:adenylate cyclase
MAEERLQRRLAAILSADVVGYSRLMGIDEAGTLARLKAMRRDLFDPLTAAHSGRIFKLMGDGALVEFASAVDAVTCAIEIQKQVRERNAGSPEDSRIQFRIGINVGDIIVDGDDIYGDGVNVAARIQALADPGGVYISRGAADQVRDKVPIKIETRGEQTVKNIARPIEVFCIISEDRDAVAGAVRESETRVQTPAIADKPAIAVLPFVNMSGEPDQEFFADGITEDILTELSRFRELFVISRNSAFFYKGKAINAQKVAKELGVHYVVEGSVRKAGGRVRITVQLIDAETDRHLWAERYDRELADIFAIQDEVTSSIVSILPGRVAAAAQDRVQRKLPENLAAYECVLAGKLLHHRSARADNEEALRMLDRAIALDPGYAHAHAWKACVLGQSFVYGWCADIEATKRTVIEELTLALSLDENDSDVHRVLAAVNLSLLRDHDKALYHQERALALNPNDDLIVVQQGEVLTWIGQAEQGIEWIQKAMRLNPYHPERFWSHLGRAYFVARRYDEAIKAFQRISRADHGHLAFLAACHAQLDDAAAAKGAAQQVLQRAPDFSIERFIATQHYKHEKDREHHRAALVKAQLPA